MNDSYLYKNGTPAKVGDQIKVNNFPGVVVEVHPNCVLVRFADPDGGFVHIAYTSEDFEKVEQID